ncbi:unnamed protein product [Nezara viridula]|uniref:Uricase n=1 Tax=Nezara viridula TaxID=85310 RepID=A0A9P0E4S4_NEZVI|nr:unnamed protein product [Nezara viridula]
MESVELTWEPARSAPGEFSRRAPRTLCCPDPCSRILCRQGALPGRRILANREYAKDYDICHAEYGKTGVKLLYIYKSGLHQTPRELEVTTRISLADRNEYKHGDNRDIIGTDSQKNIVYVLAKKHGVTSPEEFGLLLAQFLLDQYSHVVESSATVIETTWDRIEKDGMKHKHAFVHNPGVERWASVKINRREPPVITAGLRGLRVLKTTQSEFKNFYRDEYRTLLDTDDRIFSTIIKKIQMDMPNKHYMDMDLSGFPKDMVGVGVNKTVFLPTDKPSGFIHAALERKGSSKL